MPIQIVPLAEQHTLEVARLHLAYLQTPFRGSAGVRLLQCYYRVLMHGKGGVGYVAQVDHTVVGFVCGVWEPEVIRATLLSRYVLPLSFWGVLQVLTSPHLLVELANRLFGGCTPDDNEAQYKGYELRPIVVSSAHRGQGIAVQLVDTLRADAQQRSYGSLFLLTEVDNERAKAFYQKYGFQQRNYKRPEHVMYELNTLNEEG